MLFLSLRMDLLDIFGEYRKFLIVIKDLDYKFFYFYYTNLEIKMIYQSRIYNKSIYT